MMSNSSRQLLGYLMGILTWFGSILIIALPDWKHGNVRDESFRGTIIVRGLWTTCTIKELGGFECIDLGILSFSNPTLVRGCRTITIVALILSFLGLMTTPLGLRCTRIGGGITTKALITKFCAILFGTCGTLIGAAVTWFADGISNEVKSSLSQAYLEDFHYVYGNALYIGWATSVSGLLSAVLLLSDSSPRNGSSINSTRNVNKKEKSILQKAKNTLTTSKESTPLASKKWQASNKQQQLISLLPNNYNGYKLASPATIKQPVIPVRQIATPNANPYYNETLCKSAQTRTNKTYV